MMAVAIMVTRFVAMAPTRLAMLAPIERPETLLMALRVSATTEYVAIVSILENFVFRLHLREHCSWMLYKLQIPPVHGKAQALLATRAPAPIVVAHLAGKRSTASLAPGRPWLRSSVVASRCRRIVRKSRDVLRGTGNLSLEMQPNENEAKTLQIHPADEAMLKVRDRSSHSIARVAPRAMQAYATAPASKLSRQGRPMWCQGKKDRGPHRSRAARPCAVPQQKAARARRARDNRARALGLVIQSSWAPMTMMMMTTMLAMLMTMCRRGISHVLNVCLGRQATSLCARANSLTPVLSRRQPA